jgi:hypothetical protein
MTPEVYAKEYPFLFEIAEQLGESPYDFDTEFEFGIDLVLDPIERLVQRETETGKPRKKLSVTPDLKSGR